MRAHFAALCLAGIVTTASGLSATKGDDVKVLAFGDSYVQSETFNANIENGRQLTSGTSPLKLCNGTTSTASTSRGIMLQAPFDFRIIGLTYPASTTGVTTQNFQIVISDTAFSTANTGPFPGTTALYQTGLPFGQIFATNIAVKKDQYVGILGKINTGTTYYSTTCSTAEQSLTVAMDQSSVNVKTFYTATNIATSQSATWWNQNNMVPIAMYYTTSPESSSPSQMPSTLPFNWPVAIPSRRPSAAPSDRPVASPSRNPSASPSKSPAASLTTPAIPSSRPSAAPSNRPVASPSRQPSAAPSVMPVASPSRKPSAAPSKSPATSPSSQSSPSRKPSAAPSQMPEPSCPSRQPSASPLNANSATPTAATTTAIPTTVFPTAAVTSMTPTSIATTTKPSTDAPILPFTSFPFSSPPPTKKPVTTKTCLRQALAKRAWCCTKRIKCLTAMKRECRQVFLNFGRDLDFLRRRAKEVFQYRCKNNNRRLL